MAHVLNIPDEDQFEITLIGTGGGYGETIIIHIGKNQWAIIDSCKNPNTGSVLALEYLNSIGVNLKTQVKLVICTHWDDDHIRGIAAVLKECEDAKFCISSVSDRKKFLLLVSLDFEKLEKVGSVASTKELMECLNLVEARNSVILKASQDKMLLSTRLGQEKIEVFALSPSDESIRLFDSEISRLTSDFGHPSKKLIQSPNQKSVVIFLKLGKHRAILGADLEVTGSVKTGWECILKNSQSIDGKSSYFKISHHGSENGYHIDIWNNLLTDNPEATLTPWNKNQKLPKQEMIEKYRKQTSNLYITSDITSTKAKKRDIGIEKAIDRLRLDLREVKYSKGIIRSRIKIGDANWKTQLFDAARKL